MIVKVEYHTEVETSYMDQKILWLGKCWEELGLWQEQWEEVLCREISMGFRVKN